MILFRPKFCANCGEKIERADWGIFTSRRFCQVCETEFKGQDLIPQVVVAAGILSGVVGLWAYVKADPRPTENVVVRPFKAAPQPSQAPQIQPPVASSAATNVVPPAVPARQLSSQVASQAAVPKIEAEEAYICGAETKKGTPCSRRVKGNIRCFQHKGMPAMLPADKLRIG